MTEVRAVDLDDEADVRRWYDVVTAVRRDDRPEDEPPTLRAERARLEDGRRPGTEERRVPLLALLDGVPVGAGLLELPDRDNQHIAGLTAWVLPGARRRGVATALARALEELSEGRRTLYADLDEPPSVGGRSPGRALLLRLGYECVQVEVRRDLRLPADEQVLADAEREATEAGSGYDVRLWWDRCPDDLVEARAELAQTMSRDVPMGGIDYGEEQWDVARVRAAEQTAAAAGLRTLTAVAVAPDGTLAGYSEVAFPADRPEQVDQHDTLVVGAHRGRRLGLRLKCAVLRELAATVPEARRVSTGNAADNAPMIAVNERLGFVPNGTYTGWQRRR